MTFKEVHGLAPSPLLDGLIIKIGAVRLVKELPGRRAGAFLLRFRCPMIGCDQLHEDLMLTVALPRS